jgi:hypothetical protein
MCDSVSTQCRTSCTTDAQCAPRNLCLSLNCQSDLLLSISFEENMGTTVADSSGKNNNGTIRSGAATTAPATAGVFTTGHTGRGLSLNGTSQFVSMPYSDSINSTGNTGAFTVAGWVNVRSYSASTSNWLISRTEVGTSFEHFSLGLSSGKPTVGVHFFYASGAINIPTNQWVHLAATYDGITEAVFQNGVLQSSQDVGWPIAADTTDIIIGANDNTGVVNQNLDATIDEVRLYAHPLTNAEIQSLAQ